MESKRRVPTSTETKQTSWKIRKDVIQALHEDAAELGIKKITTLVNHILFMWCFKRDEET